MKKLILILLITHCSLLIVIAQTPTQEWAARYIRPSGSSGLKNYMALDKVGDCFVAGDYTDSSNDVVLIKYNSGGVQQWFRTYQGPGLAMDLPRGVVADSIGNSYITLSSQAGTYNIITIKYSPSGVQQWIKVYDSGNNDEPGDITMDWMGNIYVAGYSVNESIIIKYKPDGDTLWVRKYTQPNYRFPAFSIALDLQNNVCIGGNRIHTTNGSQEYFAIKYDSNGVFQWVQATSFNALTSLAKIKTDLNGNVIVTGMSLGGKIVTLKYNSTGSFQWQAVYQSPAVGGDLPNDMKIDKLGNILITGTGLSSISPVNSDYVTIKYNINGDSLWVNRYNGQGNNYDEAYALDLDDSNNVYITGRSTGTGTSRDYATLKYLTSGSQAWLIRYSNQSTNVTDVAYCIALDINKNVFVTGISTAVPSGNIDYATIKYSQLTGIENYANELPEKFYLDQNYPNPFNLSTIISYQLYSRSNVELNVYDISGKLVSKLLNKEQNAGYYTIEFVGNDLSSGVYFYEIQTETQRDTKKMLLIK